MSEPVYTINLTSDKPSIHSGRRFEVHRDGVLVANIFEDPSLSIVAGEPGRRVYEGAVASVSMRPITWSGSFEVPAHVKAQGPDAVRSIESMFYDFNGTSSDVHAVLPEVQRRVEQIIEWRQAETAREAARSAAAQQAKEWVSKAEPSVIGWTRLALRRTAHGDDLLAALCEGPKGASVDVEERVLEMLERAEWLRRGYFDPTLSQRVLGIVHPSKVATMQAAREVLDRELAGGVDIRRASFWWGPGLFAEEGLAVLPAVKGLSEGDVVRHKATFLRSIGMAHDAEMTRWRGVVSRLEPLGKDTRLAVCEHAEIDVCACLVGRDTPEADCYACDGTGRARRKRINVHNIERVPERKRR